MRITITVEDDSRLLARLDKLAEETGLNRQNILLAAFAQYRLDVVPDEVKKAPKRKKVSPKELDIGEGSRPKDVKEVIAFFKRRGVPAPLEQKAQLFFDHYQSNGWRVGKNPIKNWGSCLTTWQQRHPDWRKVESSDSTDGVELDEFLEWVKDERPAWYGKLRDIKQVEDIDGYYIQEYTQNIGKF